MFDYCADPVVHLLALKTTAGGLTTSEAQLVTVMATDLKDTAPVDSVESENNFQEFKIQENV